MRRGFTLIELLVASLLLGLLVSILTSIFSQSSIAWSTGVAGAANIDRARRDMANLQKAGDSLIGKSGGANVYAQSVFSGLGRERNNRAYTKQQMSSKLSSVEVNDPKTWTDISVGGADSASSAGALGTGKGFVVGVTSAGPDKKFETWDDITTWPTD